MLDFRFEILDLRFKMKSLRFIAVILLLLPIMVCAQEAPTPSIGGSLAGDMPANITSGSSRTAVTISSISYNPQKTTSGTGNAVFTYFNTKEKKSFSAAGMSGGASASGLMSSGSRYVGDVANVGGTTVSSSGPSHPRKIVTWPDDPSDPVPDPLGDALIPLAVLACAYLIWRVMRKRKRA